jgi:RNA chaperone Hfq
VTDPKAEDAEAGDPQLPPVPKNEQFASLNRLRRERTWVDVFLIGGTCLHGQIRSFDASMMLLQTRSGDIGLYHHAISTVVRAQKRGGGKTFKSRENRDGRENRDTRDTRDTRDNREPRVPQPLRARIDEPADYPDPPRRPPERAPVVIVKQRRAKSVIKPQ